ncbi:hypothetical protein METBIDRAFT_12388 [Metschnikowia bicuspidata var. bicuspidata NRRL YB-4993]|uniref:Uncharacterized protein n=1 Tax=Metschnikowia bicuspidata var. bicuspidata NRRL YB-4993 TaxID=869754 RepID=A0A1A0H910_9ASCO|nr:hypothetical protein METBIDRAFT_12388 [Metschnikowia bicuspidata var. bicuspidata NRRL YB-4993]OBA20368.1 hypothetical protein METBIDRAFT_12388 [Metschnikowia bicuspidata var. bicuspidata NRRL YB-4993]
MPRITSIWDYPLVEDLFLEDVMHPDIPKYVEHFQRYHQYPKLDPHAFDVHDSRFQRQVKWAHLMVDYFHHIPDEILSETHRWIGLFEPLEVRQFVRVKSAKDQGVVLLHFSSPSSKTDRLYDKEIGLVKIFFHNLYLKLIHDLNLEKTQQELDRLETKSGRACNAREWDTFNIEEACFLRNLIETKLCIELLAKAQISFESESGFMLVEEYKLEKTDFLLSPFLHRLMRESPQQIRYEELLARLFDENGPIGSEQSSINIDVLARGREWRGFKFGFPKSLKGRVAELLQAHVRSSYNKFHILHYTESPYDENKLEAFGVMRVSSRSYPRGSFDNPGEYCNTSLDLSEDYRECLECGRLILPNLGCPNECKDPLTGFDESWGFLSC